MLPFNFAALYPQRLLQSRLPLCLVLLTAMLAVLTGTANAGTPPSVVYTGSMQVLNTGSYNVNYAVSAMADLSGNVYMIDFGSPGTPQVLVLSPSGTVSVLATPGYTLDQPYGLWVDNSGNVLIADSGNNRILKVTGGGTGASVVNTGAYTLIDPQGVGEDPLGNIYIADTYNNRALMVAPGGAVTIIPGVSDYPEGFAFDSIGDVYIGAYFAAYEVSSSNTVTTIGTGSYSPQPWGVALDSADNLYLMDTGGDQVLKVDTLGNTTVVDLDGYTLSNPNGLSSDRYDNLYISDQNNDRYLELSLTSAGFGQVPVNTTSATQTLNFSISNATVGSIAVLTTGISGLDFNDAGGDTCTATTYTATTSCTVNVSFKPMTPGLRVGAVVIADGSGNALATVPIFGTGTGPEVGFGPSSAATWSSDYVYPSTLAVDAAGDVFVVDAEAGSVYKVTPGGSRTSIGGVFSQPEGGAVDGAGNVYVTDGENLYMVTPAGARTTIGSGFTSPGGLAVDGAGNVYVTNASSVYKVTPGGVQTTVGSGFKFPAGLAVDAAGNVYVADAGSGVDKVYKVTPGGVQTTVGSGFSIPVGVAVDAAGDVYVLDTGSSSLFEVTPAGSQSTVSTAFSSPNGVAIDSTGNLYVADSNNGRVAKIDRADPPAQSFPTSTAVGATDTTDGTMTAQLFNIGNQALSFTAITYPADFSEPAGDANACTTAAGINPAGECDIPIQFTPENAGSPLSEGVTLTDNALNVTGAQQSIPVTGTATGPVPAMLLTPKNGSGLSATSQTFTWTTGNEVTAYWFNLGYGSFGVEAKDVYDSGPISTTTVTVSNLGASGQTVYATLYSLIGGVWQPEIYTFTEGGSPVAAQLTEPTNGSTLSGTTTNFTWNTGSGVLAYWLYVGTGTNLATSRNLYNSGQTAATSATVTGIPAYGQPIYVTLFSLIAGAWQSASYTFTESGSPQKATLTLPTSGTQLNGSANFTWTAGGGVQSYWLNLGDSPTGAGSKDIYSSGPTTALTTSVSGIPTNGVTVYATLYSYIDGAWQSNQYSFTETGSPSAAVLNTPQPETTLSGPSVTFAWTSGAGPTEYWFNLGTSPTGPNSKNIYSSGPTTATSVNVTGLPTNGETIYATLYSLIDGVWQSASYTYTAFTPPA